MHVSTEIKGTAIRQVNAAMVTEDGQYMLLRLQPQVGPEMILALPASQIGNLIQIAAQGATGAREKSGVDPNVKEAFVVAACNVHQAPEDRVLLSLTLAMGGELSFQLPAGVQQPLIDRLAATLPAPAVEPSQIN
jgi:hypothetical protein